MIALAMPGGYCWPLARWPVGSGLNRRVEPGGRASTSMPTWMARPAIGRSCLRTCVKCFGTPAIRTYWRPRKFSKPCTPWKDGLGRNGSMTSRSRRGDLPSYSSPSQSGQQPSANPIAERKRVTDAKSWSLFGVPTFKKEGFHPEHRNNPIKSNSYTTIYP